MPAMALRMLILVMILFVTITDQVSTADGELKRINKQPVVVRGGGGGGENRKTVEEEIHCDKLCGVRCGAHSRPNVCMRACGTCCIRCKCVPPGTSGNREVCGVCYTGMTTHGNKTKCP